MIHTIHVTREDLEYPYFLPRGCPIWHALKREFPMARISVGDTYFSINDVHYSLPGPLGIYRDKVTGYPKCRECSRQRDRIKKTQTTN